MAAAASRVPAAATETPRAAQFRHSHIQRGLAASLSPPRRLSHVAAPLPPPHPRSPLLPTAPPRRRCDADAACTYTVPYKGSQVTYDLRGLCNPNKDYYIEDSVGHFYYAQICGTAAQQCLPSSFDNYYQAGSE